MGAMNIIGTVHDDLVRTPKLAGIHVDQAHGAENVAYREKLGNVDATTRTADNILTVLGDPKKVFTVMALVLFVIWILSRFGGEIGSFFGTLFSPLKRITDLNKAERLTGTTATLTASQADVIADDLYACFQRSGDDEAGIYSQLGKLRSAADWSLVVERFGTRRCPKPVILFHNQEHGLLGMMQCNLSDEEMGRCREILAGIGVTI